MDRKKTGDWKGELQEVLHLHGRVTARGKTKPVSNRTLAVRESVLFQCMEQIRELGYDIQSIRSLKTKHIEALVEHWVGEGISAGTIQNRLSYLRALCKWIGKDGMIPPTEEFAERYYPGRLKRTVAAVTDKSWSAKGLSAEEVIVAVAQEDRYVAMQLKVIHAFGLRREEAVQFKPHKVDEGGVLRIREGTKGGRERMVPVESDYQRQVLAEAKAAVSIWDGHIGHPGKSLAQNLRRFSYVMERMGLTKKDLGATAHGLRHQRLNDIFEEVAGVPSPVRQMSGLDSMSGSDAVVVEKGDPYLWKAAQQKVSHVGGHARLSISTAYTGSQQSLRKGKAADLAGKEGEQEGGKKKGRTGGLDWTFSATPIRMTVKMAEEVK